MSVSDRSLSKIFGGTTLCSWGGGSNESFITFTWFLSLPFIFTQDQEEEEVEAFDVSLTKNTQGLGITIAGYVGDKNSGERTEDNVPVNLQWGGMIPGLVACRRSDICPCLTSGFVLLSPLTLPEPSEPSGIFVKSITKGSAVDQDGRIHVGDQIIAVSTFPLSAFSNTRLEMCSSYLDNGGKLSHA